MFTHNNSLYDSAFGALIRPLARSTKKATRISHPQKRLLSQRARESLPLIRENNFAERLMSKLDNDFDKHFSLTRSSMFGDLRSPFEGSNSLWKDFNKRSNIREESDKYVIELNEQGISNDSLNINFSENNNSISLQATKEILNNSEGFQSASYSSFQSNFALGKPIDFSKVTREVDGEKILISIPKVTADEPQITKKIVEDNATENNNQNENVTENNNDNQK